jgi:hypothetical protein
VQDLLNLGAVALAFGLGLMIFVAFVMGLGRLIAQRADDDR